MDLFKPPNSPFPEQRVPVTSPPAPGGFGDLLGSGPRLSQTPHPWLLPLGVCGVCGRLQRPRIPLQVLPSVDWKGAAEATVSSRIRNLSYTAPSPAERWVQLCSAGSLRLGAQPGLLEDISRKGLGEGLSAWPPGASGGRGLQGAWRQASRLPRGPEQPLKPLNEPLAAEKPPGIQPEGVLLCGPAPLAASSSHPAGSTSGPAPSPPGLSPQRRVGPSVKTWKMLLGRFR